VIRTKILRAGVIAVCAAAVAALVQAPTASADIAAANVTRFRTTNVSVASLGCKYVPVTMSVSIDPSVWWADITTHIYRGSTEVGYSYFQPNQRDTWFWCPYLDGYGTFRLGPSEVAAHRDYSTTTATDRTLGYVKVKARGTEVITGSSRSRGVVTITARSSLFNQNVGGYSRWAGARVTFQYRLTPTAAWRSVATVYANRSGLATKRIAAPTVRYWRAVLAEGAQVFGMASPQVRR
jgi:hypothetical protein